MKKILVIFVCFSLLFNVKAETFYSEYSQFSIYSTNYIESSDTIDVELYNQYRYYALQRYYTGYYMEGENELPYNQYDNEDYMIETNNIWYQQKPLEKLSRVIEEKNGISGFKVRSLYLYNIEGDRGYLRLASPKIYVENDNPLYSYTCHNCSDNFDSQIFYSLYDNSPYILNDIGNLEVHFREAFNIELIKFSFFSDMQDVSFILRFSADNTFDSEEYIDISVNLNNLDKIDDMYVLNINYDNIEINKHVNSDIESKVYKYTDYYYHYYYEEKKYLDGYYSAPLGIYKYPDLEDYITFYRYRTREKIVLSDRLVVNYRNFNIDDIILESNVDYNIDTNLNLYKNGIYDVVIESPMQTINKTLLVNIYENTLQENYDKLLEEYNKLNEKYMSLQNSLSFYEDEYFKLLDALDENNFLIYDLEEQLSNLNDILSIKEEAYKSLLESYNNLLDEINNKDLALQSLINENEELQDEINIYLSFLEDLNNQLDDSNYLIDELKIENDVLKGNLKTLEITFKDQIKDLEEDIKKLQKNNNKIEQENEKLKNKIEKLQTDFNNLKKENKELEKENKSLLKNQEKLENSKNLLEGQVKELEKQLKAEEKEKNFLNNEIISQNEEIKKYEEFERQLLIDNKVNMDNLFNKYDTIIQNNIDTYNEVILEKEKEINSLLIYNDELNKTIAKQNSNIAYLQKINNENNEKYDNKILLLNNRIKSLEEENSILKDKHSLCLDEEKEMYLKQNKMQRLNEYQNILIYLIIIMTFIMNYLWFFKKAKKVELK